MLPRATNRIRPTLEALEVREVYFAGVAMGLPYPTPVALPPVGPVTSVAHVGDWRVEPIKDPVDRRTPAKPAPPLNLVDSVMTLKNETARTIRVSIRWAGSTEVTRYTLAPGQVERVSIRQVEKVQLARTAVIQFAPATGGPVRKVQVASESARVGPDGTSVGDGRVYEFRPAAAGIGLFAGPRTPAVTPPPTPFTTR